MVLSKFHDLGCWFDELDQIDLGHYLKKKDFFFSLTQLHNFFPFDKSFFLGDYDNDFFIQSIYYYCLSHHKIK